MTETSWTLSAQLRTGWVATENFDREPLTDSTLTVSLRWTARIPINDGQPDGCSWASEEKVAPLDMSGKTIGGSIDLTLSLSEPFFQARKVSDQASRRSCDFEDPRLLGAYIRVEQEKDTQHWVSGAAVVCILSMSYIRLILTLPHE